MHSYRGGSSSRLWTGALAIVFALLARSGEAAKPEASPCDLRHPIEVKVTALDPVHRGEPMRARVAITSNVELQNARVELVGFGGAQKVGSTRATLGSVAPGIMSDAVFTVQLPAAGHRFLLVFDVRGEGPNGPLARQATFNALPDGPADPGTLRTTPSGERIVEYSARRIQ